MLEYMSSVTFGSVGYPYMAHSRALFESPTDHQTRAERKNGAEQTPFFLLSLNYSPLRGLAAPDRANVARFRDAPLVPGRMPALSSRGGSRGLMMVACTETITIPSSGPGSHPGRAAAGRARFEARGFREEE
jgi:hypothetical protein